MHASEHTSPERSSAAPEEAEDLVRALFADGGPLSEVLPGYRRRPEQEAFSLKVLEGLSEDAIVLGDVPTGTGKSLGYLAAVVLGGQKAVVSTATVALQAQLQNDDAPVLSRALGLMGPRVPGQGFTHGVLKGRGNFLCLRRHSESLTQGSLIRPELLGRLDRFAQETRTGDREDLTFPVPAGVWREVASDGEDCQPRSCSWREPCFVYAAREAVEGVDVLFVNHAMLLANANAGGAVFETEGRALVVDEAHALEGVMSDAFGSRVSHGRVLYCMRTARKKSDSAAPHADRAESAADLFFDDLRNKGTLGDESATPLGYETLKGSLRSVAESLANDEKEEANATAPMVGRLVDELQSFYADAEPSHAYAVVRGEGKPTAYNATSRPELRSWLVDTDEAFREELLPLFEDGQGRSEGVSLCSATLAEGEDRGEGRSFSYVRRRLGLGPGLGGENPGPGELGRRVMEHSGEEIFDYRGRVLLYVAGDLPQPGGPVLGDGGRGSGHAEACVRRAEELVRLSGGRALILLSTNRAVWQFRKDFRVPFPVRYQGDDSTGRLVRWLRETEGAVLVGTRSLWQGVSAPRSLGLVVLDRVPFVPPGDAVFEALKERAGKGWFREVALPKARVAVRQGAGRLMRCEEDRGVVAVLDPRISSKGWGRAVLASLPPAPLAHSLEEVAAFYAAGRGTGAVGNGAGAEQAGE